MLFIKQNKTYFIVLSILIFLFDQITKYLISLNIEEILNRDFLIFTIEYVKIMVLPLIY